MIDTIRLLIPRDKIKTLDLTGDSTPSWNLHSKTDQYEKYVRNPPKMYKNSGFPRLTGYKRKLSRDANILMEFSAPKVLFLNNLDELQDSDFTALIYALQEKLKIMGILISKETLENAAVSAVHFSKNISLEDGYTASHIISEMNKVNIPKRFDLARARYVNDGESLCAHTSSHELVIYDKIADLGKTKKRAIDKDQTTTQLSLFQEIIKKKEPLEVLRFEIRLNNKRKIDATLARLGYMKNPTLKNIFNAEISRKVVNSYWKELVRERSLGMFALSLAPKDSLRVLLLASHAVKPKQAIYLTGLFLLSRDGNGIRELRSILNKKSNSRTWYRIVEDIRLSSELITKNNVRSWVNQIDKKLEEYAPFKTRSHKIDV